MTATDAKNSGAAGVKRNRESSHEELDEPRPLSSSSAAARAPDSPTTASTAASASTASSAATFRNVSACNRCRVRKNRCDQRLPACASCEKARVKCVGFDPITKKEIPRSYVYYLETRVSYLESLLDVHEISYTPPDDFALGFKTKPKGANATNNGSGRSSSLAKVKAEGDARQDDRSSDREKLNKLVSNIGMVSVHGASDSRFLGSTSGISFARVVFAAVKSSVSGAASERSGVRSSKPLSHPIGNTSMRDSFFGLHTKPTIKPVLFPDKGIGLKLVNLYFEHANPQIPILHRGEFMTMFEKTYASDAQPRTARESYMLNIVFAIGAGIIMGSSSDPEESNSDSSMKPPPSSPRQKKRKMVSQQHQPEEYHASAIVHLESFLGSSPAADRPDGFGGGLEELQAVLLLAGFALLRPVAPGLWYIIGVAVRLAVDLGLHYEDGVGIDSPGIDAMAQEKNGDVEMKYEGPTGPSNIDARERGRREWLRDLRRRLWWSVYSFDRLVSTCVGRPFGITDQVVTTEFPSALDDKYITQAGFLHPPGGLEAPSYKSIAYHYFRLRLLQSEILQVLQHRQSQQARAGGANQGNEFMHTKLSSPFLEHFSSFRSWRLNIDRRLWEWKESAPSPSDTGVSFSPLFLDLNYWQAVIMLYRQSLSVPPVLAGELGSTNEDVQSPSLPSLEDQDEEERVFIKVAEAGQKVLKLYRQLHRVRLVNYTYLATHHLFMAGISFLYAIWHSNTVRSHLSLDDVDFTVLAATSVLDDLIEKCPPAEACRDAFTRMSKATIQMCLSTTGFGAQAAGLDSRRDAQLFDSPTMSTVDSYEMVSESGSSTNPPQANYPSAQNQRRPQPHFDMSLRDLFDESEASPFGRLSTTLQPRLQPQSRINTQAPRQNNPNISPNLTFTTASSSSTSFATSGIPATAPQVSPYAVSNTVPYSNFAQNINSTYPDLGFNDLDFLDTFPVGTGSGNGMAANGGTDWDLGFAGMGWDGNVAQSSWGGGHGFDMFDGFFFGGGTAG